MVKNRTTKFTITGVMKIAGRKVKAYDGAIIGYKLPDGSEVRLLAAIEVEKNGKSKIYATDKDMQKLGFCVESYDHTDFET